MFGIEVLLVLFMLLAYHFQDESLLSTKTYIIQILILKQTRL